MLSVDEGIMRCEGKEKMKPKRKEIASRSRAISLLCEGCNTARTTTRKPLYFISPQLRLLPGTATVTTAMTDTNLCGLDLLIIADLAPSLTLSSSAPILSIQPGRRLQEARTAPDARMAFVKYLIGTVAAICCACSQGEFFFCSSFFKSIARANS